MAEVRYIKTRMWSDQWFRGLTPKAKLLFIYLLTNINTSLSGYYEIDPDIVLLQTGITQKEVPIILRELIGHVDFIDGWVCLKNYAKHQNAANSPKVQALIDYDTKKVPKHVLDHSHSTFHSILHSESIDRVSIPYPPSPKKEEKNEEIKHKFGEFKNVLLTNEEKEKLKEVYGRGKALELVEALSAHVKSIGKDKYASHYATIRNWARRDKVPENEKPKQPKPTEKEPELTEEEKARNTALRKKISESIKNKFKKP